MKTAAKAPTDPTLTPAKLLTIAGSDSGGAAGLQADLRAWAVLGAYGLCALTAVTAQNSVSVEQVQFSSPALVAAQMTAVLRDYGADGAKTGFIGRSDLIITISARLQQFAVPNIIVDPVLVNHLGKPMFPDEIRRLYLSYLVPLATVLTPNVAEAAVLLGSTPPARTDLARLAVMARELQGLGAGAVLLKGGQAAGQQIDLLYDGRDLHHLTSPYIATPHTHGAGDTLSAALCAELARGHDLLTAVKRARHFTATAITRSAKWQMGSGHGPVIAYNSL